MPELFAAIPTPLRHDGRVDEATLDRLLEFVINAGVDGVCIGGATGEYPHVETSERKALIRRAASRLPKGATLLTGIGGPSLRATLDLGEAAMHSGSRAALLPMPAFFRYEQQDLQAYCEHVSRALRAPCLLYDLPEFTNGLEPETSLALLRHEEFIVGIKDSSGRAENLQAFAELKENAKPVTLLVGDDRLLHAGLLAAWDGGISGVAACCPELLVALVRSVKEGLPEEAASLHVRLMDLIAQLSVFPTPWGIRVALAARGFDTGPLPLPVSTERALQIAEFQRWFSTRLDAFA
jgi:4-hydroxy-tetrahydrodipicolinate synthase